VQRGNKLFDLILIEMFFSWELLIKFPLFYCFEITNALFKLTFFITTTSCTVHVYNDMNPLQHFLFNFLSYFSLKVGAAGFELWKSSTWLPFFASQPRARESTLFQVRYVHFSSCCTFERSQSTQRISSIANQRKLEESLLIRSEK
jgi:hypothetical protein